ncbi:MAG TPA: type III-B CRISPR module RAMP protein Cmr4 [Ktedonobacteraceae bacterium]|nr:type III-B CRISPR module RAMP protein Cmr4 [Ktedonobacteraceae bacterium]
MIQEAQMLYLYVETPLHAGTGSGLSSIDLPIQRERTTQYPMIQGSGIKGKLRGAAEDFRESLKGTDDKEAKRQDNIINAVFGTSPTNRSEDTRATGQASTPPQESAGALVVGDARLLLFPVRSLSGIFAYVTCEDILNRFSRDLKRGSDSNAVDWDGEIKVEEQQALVTTASKVIIAEGDQKQLVLEEFSFNAESNKRVDTIAKWIADHAFPTGSEYAYWRSKIQSSLVILTNDDFRDFVLYATEIITRIKLDRATKTVSKGALWTEEHLPTDTLLYVPLYATNARVNGNAEDHRKNGHSVLQAKEILGEVQTLEKRHLGYLQLGGDETVGRGIVRMHLGNDSK